LTISEIDPVENGVPSLLKLMHKDQPAHEEKNHDTVKKPSLPRLTNHPAKGVGQRRWQEHD